MKRERGFTLIELVVVIAIVGILTATAIPFYNTYRMRTYGSEAIVTINRILRAEIVYYLENEDFFPLNFGDTLQVFSDGTTKFNGSASATVIQDIVDALQVTIPVGHNLDFTIVRCVDDDNLDAVMVAVSSAGGAFPLHSGGAVIMGLVNKDGKIQ